MSSPLKLRFPESEYDYWYLYWIGNPYIKRKKMYVDIYFCNCRNPDDKIRPFESDFDDDVNNFVGIHHTITVLYSSVLLYALGSIFGRDGKVIVEPGQMQRKTVNILLKPSDRATKISEFKDLGDILKSDHPLAEHFINHDSKCFFSRRSIGKKTYTVMLPVSVVAQSFFFYSNSLSELIIFARVNEIFNREDLIQYKNENGEKVLEIHYNNELVNENEIRFLSNHLAVGIDPGYKALQFLGGNLLQQLITSKQAGENEPEALLDLILPFDKGIVMDAMGKYFGEDLILIYEIEKCDPYNNKPLFDKIDFVKKNPNFKWKENDKNGSGRRSGVKVIPTKNDGTEITPHDDKVNDKLSDQIREGNFRGVFDFPDLDRQVLEPEEAEIRLGVKQHVVVLPPGEGISTGGDQDEDFDKSYANFCQAFTLINREVYMEELVAKLKKLNVDCQFISLVPQSIKANKFLKIYGGRLRTIMIVELNHEDRFFYLIEFPTGMTGFLSKVDLTEASKFELDRFIEKYLVYQELVNSKDKSLFRAKFPNGQYYIRKKNENKVEMSRLFIDDYSIALYPFIEHQQKHMKDTEHLIEHTSSKIMSRMQKAIKDTYFKV